VRSKDAAVLLEECDAFNVSDCTIFDSDGAGLLLRDVTRTRIGGCVVRARGEGKPSPALRVTGGKGNWITQNLLENGYGVPAGMARVEEVMMGSEEGLVTGLLFCPFPSKLQT
jgi:hypothetical protein